MILCEPGHIFNCVFILQADAAHAAERAAQAEAASAVTKVRLACYSVVAAVVAATLRVGSFALSPAMIMRILIRFAYCTAGFF